MAGLDPPPTSLRVSANQWFHFSPVNGRGFTKYTERIG